MAKEWLKNSKITLRSPEPEDLELLYKMENDTALWNVGNATLPYSRYTLRRYLEQSKQDIFSERQARFIIELPDGSSAGMIDLADYDSLHGRAEVCIGLLREFCNRGIGSQALGLIVDYARGILHLHQLYAYIPEDNSASRALFNKMGFSATATLKDWRREPDGYKNIVLFQLILQ